MNSINNVGTDYSRITGLASGMDIDGMVKSMLKAASIPLDKLEQQKQILEWQREDYRTLNTALYSFKDQAFNLKLQGTFNAKTAASSAEQVAGATAGGNAIAGTYAITVNNLASGVSKGSTVELADARDSNGNYLSLYQQFTEFGERGFSAADTIAVTINGTVLEFELGQDNISTVVAKINEADLGVTASYDSNYKRFFLNTTSSGSEASITISGDTAGFLSHDINNSSILNLNIEQGVSYRGQNASINIGDAIGLESATNTITVNGLTLALKGEGSSTITVSHDIDGIVNSIKGFVDSYNDTINKLYSKVQETRNRKYAPLTDAQKEEMSEDEIKKWEEKARSGLLRNDMYLQNTISNLRSSMSRMADIDGQYKQLSQIGLASMTWYDNGKLYIDEDKLREAVSTDPEGVKQLFTHSSSNPGEQGIAMQLYDVVSAGIASLADKAGSTSSFSTVDESYMGKRLTEMQKSIEKWEDKLNKLEERYYKNFTAMEAAISSMNYQSLWLAQQFGTSS